MILYRGCCNRFSTVQPDPLPWILIELAIILGVDPRAVRPEIELPADRLALAIMNSEEEAFGLRLSMFPSDIQRESLNYAGYFPDNSEEQDVD